MASGAHPFVLNYHDLQHHYPTAQYGDIDIDQHYQPPHQERAQLPPIPDLRFEYSYIRSVRKCLQFNFPDSEGAKSGKKREVSETEEYEKVESGSSSQRQETAVELLPSPRSAHPTFIIERIDWGSILWITTRDQIISPFLQGMLWGVASEYINPLMRRIFPGKKKRPGQITVQDKLKQRIGYKDGQATEWLRDWVKQLGFTTAPTTTAPGTR